VIRLRKVALSGTTNGVERDEITKVRVADHSDEVVGRTRHE
jgi:hypothetical protein